MECINIHTFNRDYNGLRQTTSFFKIYCIYYIKTSVIYCIINKREDNIYKKYIKTSVYISLFNASDWEPNSYIIIYFVIVVRVTLSDLDFC